MPRRVFKRLEEPSKAILLISSRLSEMVRKNLIQEPPEITTIDNAVGRVLLEDVYAPFSLPYYPRSLVDGCAVISEDVATAGEDSPVKLKYGGRVKIGEKPKRSLSKGECIEVDTGAWIPLGADGVVPIEHVDLIDEDVLIYKSVGIGQNFALPATDVAEGDLVLSRYTLLDARMVAAIASLGMKTLHVTRKIRVAVASTGNELIEVSEPLSMGKIYDSNRHYIISRLTQLGSEVIDAGIIPDDREELENFIQKTLPDADIIMLSGGTSAGPDDLVYQVVEDLGVLHIHGIRIKPGKPTVIGEIQGKPFFGLPGNPRSAANVLEKIIIPGFSRGGIILDKPCRETEARLAYTIYGTPGRATFIPVALYNDVAYPLARESYMIVSQANSDATLFISGERHTPLQAGNQVTVSFERQQDRTVVLSFTDIDYREVELPVEKPYRIIYVPYTIDLGETRSADEMTPLVFSQDQKYVETRAVDLSVIAERKLFLVRDPSSSCSKMAIREGYMESSRSVVSGETKVLLTPRFKTSQILLEQGYVNCAILPEEYSTGKVSQMEKIYIKKEKVYFGYISL